MIIKATRCHQPLKNIYIFFSFKDKKMFCLLEVTTSLPFLQGSKVSGLWLSNKFQKFRGDFFYSLEKTFQEIYFPTFFTTLILSNTGKVADQINNNLIIKAKGLILKTKWCLCPYLPVQACTQYLHNYTTIFSRALSHVDHPRHFTRSLSWQYLNPQPA